MCIEFYVVWLQLACILWGLMADINEDNISNSSDNNDDKNQQR